MRLCYISYVLQLETAVKRIMDFAGNIKKRRNEAEICIA